jgi:cysteinyl-tRNA synthetase
MTDDELLGQKNNYKDWKQWINEKITVNQWNAPWNNGNPYWTGKYGAWSARVGARFSF